MTVTRPQLIVSMIPEELRALPQWVNYTLEWNAARGKYNKEPYNARTGQHASSTDRSTWSTFEVALANYKSERFPGVGFVFTPDDPYAGIDLDGCFDPTTETIEAWAEEVIQQFESYTEVTPSETGVHIVVRGALPPGGGHNKHSYEAYDQGRFFTFTGQVLDGRDVIHERTDELEDFCRVHFPAGTTYHVETDSDLIERAKAAVNGDKFARVWNGDDSDYAGDASAGDLGLANHLLFWTEGDTLRADMLFRRSDRMRPKWDERHYGDGTTYGQHTIAVAFATWRQEHGTAQADGIEAAPKKPEPKGGVVAFPVHVLPKVVQEFAIAWAKELHSLPEIVALPCIAFASGAIGTTREIRITPQYTETALIWAGIIAPVGSAKSAAIRNAGHPLTQFNAREMRDYKNANETYKWDVSHRVKGSEPPVPPKPPRRRLFSNATWEAIGKINSEDPHGGISINDELAAWQLSMNQYKASGSGSDRQAWLSNWSGEPVTVDRVREGGSYFIEKPFISVLGSIQPDLLPLLTNELGNDGFLARFLFVNVPRLSKRMFEYDTIPEHIQKNWFDALETLLTYEVEVLVTMTPASFAAFQAGSAWASEQSNALAENNRMQDFYFKSERAAARLALILHCIREASGEVEEDVIDEETVNAAWELVKYFAATMKYVILRIDESKEDRDVETLVAYASEHGGSVTVKEAQHDGLAGIKKASDMKTLFLEAQDRGFGKVNQEPQKGGPRYTFVLHGHLSVDQSDE